jgi:hypothetical protein
MTEEKRKYLDYCPECLLFGHCDGPKIVKNPEERLLGDWEGIKETSCRKFQGEKPAGELSSLNPKNIKATVKGEE